MDGRAAISAMRWQRKVIWDMNGNGLPLSGTQCAEGNRHLTNRWYRLAWLVAAS